MWMVSVIVYITLALLLISHSRNSSSRLHVKILDSFNFTDPPHHKSAAFDLLGVILPSTSSKPKKQLQVPFFIFGDSLVDAGNNNYVNNSKPNQASLWPYGETYFKHPTGRFSNGRLIPDFIAQLAGTPLIPPFLQPGLHEYHYGVNFASAGSGALEDTNLATEKTINLQSQLRNYMKVVTWFRGEVGNVEAQKRISQAVHLLNVGINDYKSTVSTNIDSSNYVEMVIGNLSTVVKEIYKSGGRKFLFLTLMDMRYMPQVRMLISQGKGRQVEEAASLQERHNKQLLKLCVELEQNLDYFMYMIYDFNQSSQIKIQSPTKYGFREEKMSCCGSGKFRGYLDCGSGKYELCENPNEYMFWDSCHPTEKAIEQMTDEMWRGGTHQIGPYNVKQLFQLV